MNWRALTFALSLVAVPAILHVALVGGHPLMGYGGSILLVVGTWVFAQGGSG